MTFSNKATTLTALNAYLDAGLDKAKVDAYRTSILVGGHNFNSKYLYDNGVQFREEPEFIDALSGIEGIDPSVPGLITEVLDVYGPSYIMLTSSPEEQLASWVFVKWLLAPLNQARFIEATASFPLRAATLVHLGDFSQRHPQWRTAVEALPLAQGEPDLASWGVVRWALQDAGVQLFRSYFTIDQIPGLVGFLDRTASDLHGAPGASKTPGVAPWAPTSTP